MGSPLAAIPLRLPAVSSSLLCLSFHSSFHSRKHLSSQKALQFPLLNPFCVVVPWRKKKKKIDGDPSVISKNKSHWDLPTSLTGTFLISNLIHGPQLHATLAFFCFFLLLSFCFLFRVFNPSFKMVSLVLHCLELKFL